MVFMYMEEIMIRMILDVATMRVIYYTENLNEDLHLVEKTLMYDYSGELPERFTLNNCWNWKLVGNKLVEDEPVANNTTPPYTLFDWNKSQALNLLITKVNQARKNLLSDCEGGILLRVLKYQETFVPGSQFIKGLSKANNMLPHDYIDLVKAKEDQTFEMLRITEINREYYKYRLLNCYTDEDLFMVRDELNNANFLELQVKL